MSSKKNKLTYGWGINDVDYEVTKYEVIGGKRKQVWRCPYYKKWASILERCFCTKLQTKYPTYRGCTISEDWKYLSDFIKWVNSQSNKNWKNCEADKDFLSIGNKHYSPETVVFICQRVNTFINRCGKSRGEYMLGVSPSGKACKSKPYMASCRNTFTGKGETVGRYMTELEAHKAWQARKHQHACHLADLQQDERIASRLREMYAPDKDWTNK